jgi:hypothetical protein
MAIYAVPTRFYLDHANRCDLCLDGNPLKVIKEGRLLTTLDLDAEMLDDLYSDADYYSSLKGTPDYAENREIVDSAINTLKRLQKEGK